MTLRPALPADAPALAALHAEAFPTPWTASDLGDLLSAPGAAGVLCDQGFALVRVVADEAELLTLAVLPDSRRRGVGRALLGHVLESARTAGAVAVHLEVAADNAAALRLYEGAGFRRSGLRRGYYARPGHASEDAVLMRLALNTPVR